MIKKELIQLNIKASNKEEAIKKAFEPFLKSGYIDQEYIDDSINALKDYGPYIAIAPRIALPHSNLCTSVHKPAIGITVLEEPVYFGSVNDPIKYLFPLCANAASGHMASLVALSDLFSDKDLFDLLDSCTSEQELFDIMQQKNV